MAAHALVALFRLGDPDAEARTGKFLATGYPGIDDPSQDLLGGLGTLSDPASLSALAQALGSKNVYVAQFAAWGLSMRREAAAEQAMVEAFLDPKTEGDAWGVIRNAFEKTGSPTAARALLRYASERRDVRDDVSATLRGWLEKRPDATRDALQASASDADAGVARLARGFLERCESHVPAVTGTPSACRLPGCPDEGDALDGASCVRIVKAWRAYVHQGIARNGPPPVNFYVRMQPVGRPLYLYAVAFGSRSGRATYVRLAEQLGRRRSRHAGTRAFVAPGESVLLSNTYGQSFGPQSEVSGTVPSRPMGENDGELVFFIGEEKYRAAFTYEAPVWRSLPVP